MIKYAIKDLPKFEVFKVESDFIDLNTKVNLKY